MIERTCNRDRLARYADAYQCDSEYLYKLVATRGVGAPDTRAAFMPGRRTQRIEDKLAFTLETRGMMYPRQRTRGQAGVPRRRLVVGGDAMLASLWACP